jgi:hypothetical protein
LTAKKPRASAISETPAQPDPGQQTSTVPAVFEPEPCHHRYLLAYVQALEDTGNVSDRAIAGKLNVAHETISRWRRRSPGFRVWVSQQLEAMAGEDGSAILKRCAVLALRGSAKHMELHMKATGRIEPDSMKNTAPTVNIQVIGIAGPTKQPGEWPGGYLEDGKRA